jgi:hypothetical protein
MSFSPKSRLSSFISPSPDRQKQELRVTDYSKQLRLPLSEHVTDYTQRDLDATEGFLRYLLMLESEPSSSLAKQLIRDGIELPEPESLDDNAVSQKLEQVIQGLAKLHTYLMHTDHLSDRELYEHLWWEALNEPEYEFDEGMGQFQTTIDLVGDGSEASMEIYHRYYADELDRDWWRSENPHCEMPDMEPAPYDRDRHLPQPAF